MVLVSDVVGGRGGVLEREVEGLLNLGSVGGGGGGNA